jgi:hypothetical protein
MNDNDLVYFKCIREGSRLRIKIISPGYNNNANCQFPKNIRKDGYEYSAHKSTVKFGKGRGANGKFFYRVPKSAIKVLDENVDILQDKLKNLKIYKDDDDNTCVVCFDNERELIFVSCGHFVMCKNCYKELLKSNNNRCPMCRSEIEYAATQDELQ